MQRPTALGVLLLLLCVASVPLVAGEKRTKRVLDDLFNSYDFIIVGSGASGSIVTTRIIQGNKYSVLLLEGGLQGTGQRDLGGTDYVASDFTAPDASGKRSLNTPWTRYDVPLMQDTIRSAANVLDNMWNISAVGPFYAQAKVIGGNMATNGLAWSPLLKSNIDAWNIPGFSSAEFWPYVQKVENATETGYPNRGTTGYVNIVFPEFVEQTQYRFKEMVNAAGYDDGGDINAGVIPPNFIYRSQTNTKDGIRQSTSLAYLKRVLGHPKLTFRTGCVVTKVLFENFFKPKEATGVEYYDYNGNTPVRKTAYARREVIIAAGDLQTAKLLFYSGIGPAAMLTQYGIPVRVANNLIGQKIRNHQRAALSYNDTTLVNPNFYSYPSESVNYAANGGGIIGSRGSFSFVYPVSPTRNVQMSAGAVSGANPSIYAQGFSITISPTINDYANGTIEITSSNPLAGTIFKANTFVVDADVEVIALGMEKMRQMVATHWPTAVETAPGLSVTGPALRNYIKQRGGTACHYHGSTPMGTSPTSPTNTKWFVNGVENLRIVGPSIIPGPTNPSMQLLACALGEKGADLIKADNPW